MAKLWLLCGAPGSGKTSWVWKHKKEGVIVVSRDEIRFSILGEDDSHFAHEKEVRKEMYRRINAALAAGHDVIADQTSVSKGSRALLLGQIYEADSFGAIWFDTPLEECLERNENRAGTREYVPRGQIRRFYVQFEVPTTEEGFSTIVKVNKDGTWHLQNFTKEEIK